MEGQKLGKMSILGKRHSLTQSLNESLTHSFSTENVGTRLPIHVSDTAAISQDGSSLEFFAAAAARECNIPDARGGGLWS